MNPKYIGPALWIGGGILAIIMIRKLLSDVGVIEPPKTAAEKAADNERQVIATDQQVWGTKLWRDYPQVAYTEEQAKTMARHIENSFSWYNDDEAKIIGVFRQIPNRVNVSQVSYEYSRLFGRDMLSDLQDYLSEERMSEIYDLIRVKPDASKTTKK
jgi:hypothetical protein